VRQIFEETIAEFESVLARIQAVTR
jgi:hypothetical protein